MGVRAWIAAGSRKIQSELDQDLWDGLHKFLDGRNVSQVNQDLFAMQDPRLGIPGFQSTSDVYKRFVDSSLLHGPHSKKDMVRPSELPLIKLKPVASRTRKSAALSAAKKPASANKPAAGAKKVRPQPVKSAHNRVLESSSQGSATSTGTPDKPAAAASGVQSQSQTVKSDTSHVDDGSGQGPTELASYGINSVPLTSGRKYRTGSSPLRKIVIDHPIPKPSASAETLSVDADQLSVTVLPRTGSSVPRLCHDLSRVLFNPGVYHLQDPRSRVYNFDPYLEKIMPVSEFDFKMIKQYITSSKDNTLRSLALQHGKKYVGSSSSTTATLTHFHYLLSQWRKLNTQNLSRGFADSLESFTVIQRSPSSVFLRYQDGVYSLDADKQYDTANVLMSLGKSMEKLLTLPPGSYERYRKSSPHKIPEELRTAPEAYQYSHFGNLLLRGQLDAWDPRLPGTGIFDLKSRAVAAIRHQIREPEEGLGYEIKSRFGTWESYEREYFDLMRAGFLKYSLQVRIGQMDGVFTAFHNIERIFGFQYISLPEMDAALHGQSDPKLGDQEFALSLELLNQTLDRVTERFPKRSLRLLFDTRDLPVSGVYTNIFAEPIEESEIDALQEAKSSAIDAFEQAIKNPEKFDLEDLVSRPTADSASLDAMGQPLTDALLTPAVDGASTKNKKSPDKYVAKELMALRLRIQNRVDGVRVVRPVSLSKDQKWTVEYGFEETKEPSAQMAYRTSRNRRRAAMDLEARGVSEYYIKKLRVMSADGVEYRKALDKANEGRGKVVLYGDNGEHGEHREHREHQQS